MLFITNGSWIHRRSDSGSWLRKRAQFAKSKVVTWTREEWSACAAHRWEYPPQTIYRSDARYLYCPSVVVGRTFHKMCIFRWIFRAINGRRKKATSDRECQLWKSKSLAQTSPERLFSVAFFFLWVSQVLLVQHIHCFQSKMYTKKPKYMNKGTACELRSYTQSDLALDFSPRSHSSIWSLYFSPPISDNLQGIRKRTNKELCKLKMHDTWVVMCKYLYYFYWVKQSRTSQSWHTVETG